MGYRSVTLSQRNGVEGGQRKRGEGGLAYLSLQLPAMPVVPVQRMMMLEVRDGPVQ